MILRKLFLLTVCAGLLGWLGLTAPGAQAEGRTPLSVWFVPTANSPDVGDLFTKPNQWNHVRSLVDIVGFGPGQLEPAGGSHTSLFSGLVSVDAFRRIKEWGKDTAIEVPALKEWDCSALRTPAVTVGLMKAVYAAGGTVQFLAMDEPLISALGLNRPICKEGLDAAAAKVAAYAHAVMADPVVLSSGIVPQVIDTEAYPTLTVQQIEAWIAALERHGFKPAGFHLDADVHAIDVTPNGRKRVVGDLQDLQRFLQPEKISFGIMIWSGYDPVSSDEEYYHRTMTWVQTVHNAIGRPDRVVFESWVKRCPNSDRGGCGTIGVPMNLPEDGPVAFSHTKLINDAVAVLGGQ
ncbi:MAG: hypothetical protein P4L71_17085 [Acetobacteraceae bacterium]|nr:hypothetical protein [Acetobacteraceae bacterium]